MNNMKKHAMRLSTVVCMSLIFGCALEEVRSKNKLGAEWRHGGARSTAEERYSVEPGFDFKWDKGVSTGIGYRRRDIDNGSGDSDNGLFVDVSFPLWKRKKADKTAERVEALERRLAELETERATYAARIPLEPLDPAPGQGENRQPQEFLVSVQGDTEADTERPGPN
jgi:hypothetical protein